MLDYQELKQAYEQFEGDSKMKKEDFVSILNHIDYGEDSKISYQEFLNASIDISTLITKEKID